MSQSAEKNSGIRLGEESEISIGVRQKVREDLDVDKIKIIEQIEMGPGQLADAILVLLGLKPSTELDVYRWNENPDEVKRKIKEAGLLIKEKKRKLHEKVKLAAKFVIALDEKLVDELMVVEPDEDHVRYGELMGFPETAIKAFVGEIASLRNEDHPDMSGIIFTFRMSKDHYEEEFQVLKDWSEAIKKYAPHIYDELNRSFEAFRRG